MRACDIRMAPKLLWRAEGIMEVVEMLVLVFELIVVVANVVKIVKEVHATWAMPA